MYSLLLTQNKRMALLLCSVLIPSISWGLSKDIEQPVNIEADTVMFNNEKGIANYQGHVIIVQGSLEIRADKVNIQAPDHEIVSIVATGKPVKMQQTMDDGQLVKGQGNTITYQVKGKKIILTGKAKLEQGKDMISNNNITYLPASGELKAGGKKNSGRVKAVFHPSNKVKTPSSLTKGNQTSIDKANPDKANKTDQTP